MKEIIFILFYFAVITTTTAQDLYVKTFGNKSDEPVLFLHGGPGYNSAVFEATTAKTLSEKGYYVIVYDRRGEGRSANVSPAEFTFSQTFDDINKILKGQNIKKVTLIGHSFGGIVATLFAEKHPGVVEKLFLISTPVVMQETFRTILDSSQKLYESKKDTTNLYYLGLIRKMDTTSIAYSSYTFMHAMQNGFYATKTPDETAKKLYTEFGKDSLAKYASQMTQQAPLGFLKNEHYTTLNLTAAIQNVKRKGIKIYAMYGKDDGLYSPEQVAAAGNLIGKENVLYLGNCSHNLFMDRQEQFISTIYGF
ncbi:alpha/beta hydrolase [Dyadobacter psychrotolerans]|uniref:Alpha/beta hydrolase n=1 Tax=Dyadobacter psychrotolerans TaxID=2541721 RepID=A0A4R5DFL4_9BACT|nr:alpha/beta hydrolase [Dyadobacter psychrotolerans]TDE11967.1 alpha/beta hydrolase [Dyadobacter psychrotolerans]